MSSYNPSRVVLLTLFTTSLLLAHAGQPLSPQDLWTAWRFDPGVCIPLLFATVLYGRGIRNAQGIKTWQVASFSIGLASLGLALISPVHALGEVLFSAHMIQHEILMLVAAPLLVLSRPLVPMLWGLPFEARRTAGRLFKAPVLQSLWRGMTRPAAAWTIHAAALWLWHAPPAFGATLKSEWVHGAQHAGFFGSALLFWWSLFHSGRTHNGGAAVVYLFTTAVHTSALGALLTFARTPWYSAYALTAPAWGVSALADQQAGGLIMWVPGGLIYLGAALAIFAAWLRGDNALPHRSRYAA